MSGNLSDEVLLLELARNKQMLSEPEYNLPSLMTYLNSSNTTYFDLFRNELPNTTYLGSFRNNSSNTTYRDLDRLVEVSFTFSTVVMVIYIFTAIVAFFANLFAVLILFHNRRTSRQLNHFLSNLGFSDIIFSIFNIPFTYVTLIHNTWRLPEFLCPLSGFIQVLAPTVAFYTLIAIGVGRYYVIVTGQESVFLSKSSYTKQVILSIWIFSTLVASPIFFTTVIRPVTYKNQSYVECIEDWSLLDYDNISFGHLYTMFMFVITFVLPMVAIIYLYGHIGIIVYKHQLPVGNDNRVTNQNLSQTKVKVVKMLVLLVISFIVCWSPYHIFYLLLWFFDRIRDMEDENGYYRFFYYTIYFIFHWLSCSHSIINPFIYCFFSNNFQKSDLLDLLCCRMKSSSRTRQSANQLASSVNNQGTSFRRSTRSPPHQLNETMITLRQSDSMRTYHV